ncbi:MAG: plastocyanin/azurin family copper-binding protein [Chloroflexota bacterium]
MTSSISNFAFAAASGPAPLVVRWTNNDTVEHDVILADGSSPVIAPGASFERRFDRPGTYAYSCSFHPFMTGTVVVR